MMLASDSSRTGCSRSWLFTPANRPDRFGNAVKSGADVLIVDIEDAVPHPGKALARLNVRSLLDMPPSGISLATVAVRINAGSTRAGLEDLHMLLEASGVPRFLVLPKVESAAQVVHVDTLLKQSGKTVSLVPMIESTWGLQAAASIARAADSVAGLMFGAADYAADGGFQANSLALQLARCQLAAACGGTDVIAIDAPCFVLHDAQQLQADLAFACDNGFGAKAAIHPAHIQAINSAFTPTEPRIAWAHKVLETAALGVGTVEGQMVDEAIARQARRILAASGSHRIANSEVL